MVAHLPKELFRKEAVLVTVLHKGMLRYKVRSVPGHGGQRERKIQDISGGSAILLCKLDGWLLKKNVCEMSERINK